MKEFWVWATVHWFLGFLLVYVAMKLVASLVIRTYRLFMVLIRGWPSTPFMDADGDIVLPKNRAEK